MPSAYLPSLGGVEELTRHLALALVDAGDDVEIWAQGDDEGRLAPVETMDGLTVRRFSFPLPRAHPRAVGAFSVGFTRTLFALRAAGRAFRPQVIHVQCFGPNGLYATALSRLIKIPLVVSLQGETVMDDHDAYQVSTTLRTALRLGLRQARQVTACSNFTLDDARARFGLGPKRGLVIFNGVSVGAQPDPPAPDQRYVLALGRLEDKKGFDLLIRAFARLIDAHPDVHLLIAGSGSAAASLQELIENSAAISRIHLIGRLTREQVATTMAGAEVFVLPSRVEPFGIVVLEAWRAGVASIVTSHGGPPEFVTDGEDGLVVDPFDTPALAEAIDRLLRHPDQRRAIGTAARQRVATFDWRVIAGQYRDCYSEVTHPTRGH
jgi:glycogen(starch) synthase